MVQISSKGIRLYLVWTLIYSEQAYIFIFPFNVHVLEKRKNTLNVCTTKSIYVHQQNTNKTPFTKLPCLHNCDCSGPIDICAYTRSIYLYIQLTSFIRLLLDLIIVTCFTNNGIQHKVTKFVRISLCMYTNRTPFSKLPCLHNCKCIGPIDICACIYLSL